MDRMHRTDRKDRLPALALVATLALVACSGGDDATDTLAPVRTSLTSTTPTLAPTTTLPATTTEASTTITTVSTTEAPPTTPPPTTSTPTTAAPTTAAPTTTAATQTLALRQDGLGVAPFGAEADAAVAAVTAALGAPSEDTGWVDPVTISACAGTELRRVSWGVLSLYLGEPSAAAPGTRQFFSYSYGDVADLGGQPAGLETPEGIGLGDPLADLRAAYPAVEVIPGEEGLIEPGFFVNDNLGGLLTGEADADSVTVVFGGPFCG